jgi:hypothetical protein
MVATERSCINLSLYIIVSTSLSKYKQQVTGSSLTSVVRKSVLIEVVGSPSPAHSFPTSNLWSIHKRSDQLYSLALKVRKIVSFPSCRIIANTYFFLVIQYCTILGIDFKNARLHSIILSINCLSSIFSRVSFFKLSLFLKFQNMLSVNRIRITFIAILLRLDSAAIGTTDLASRHHIRCNAVDHIIYIITIIIIL